MLFLKKLMISGTALFSAVSICAATVSTDALAVTDYLAEAEYRKSLPIQTNEIPDWPIGPAIGAEAAILMDADTGVILYGKNIHEQLYPASTTKILTCLIAVENCSLDETVTFSHDAIFSVPRDGSHIALDVGEELTMEESLSGILIASANEASNGVAEHISGSIDAFAEKMNQRAKELGCVDSHFSNANGLFAEDHYTSAYDLATIGRAFFANELLCKLSCTKQLHIPPSAKQPDDIIETSKNQLFKGRPYEYEYLVGSKTGFTSEARQTLVSCAEKDGMKLICVILKEESPYQFEDTVTLFDYGFHNFKKINISETETKYTLDNAGFFYSNNDIFGSSKPILSLNSEDCIILPKTVDFSETESSISYESAEEGEVARINYTYHNVPVGYASVNLATDTGSYEFNGDSETDGNVNEKENQKGGNVIFINIVKIILWVIGIAGFIILMIILRAVLNNYYFANRRRRRRRKRRQQQVRTHRYRSPFEDYRRRHR